MSNEDPTTPEMGGVVDVRNAPLRVLASEMEGFRAKYAEELTTQE
jgi:hypothetical protein